MMRGDVPLEATEKRFQYRGSLSEKALPEILATIDRFRVPGVIEVTRGEVVKRIYLKEGSVVHAASNDRNDSLGSYLARTGRLSGEQCIATMRERAASEKRYGVLLIDREILSPAEVYRAIRKQVEEIVWSLFTWTEGEVSFSIGEFEARDLVRIQLPMRQVILKGIKRSPDAKALVTRLGRKETVFLPCYQTEDLIEVALHVDDHKLLSLIDGRRTLYEVCAEGPYSAADNAKLMYAFQVLQLVRRVGAEAPPPRPAETSTRESGAIKIRFKTQGDQFNR